jgi:catechol 2,3-dioxygenase-like lactoylglutathione lyase family enzyme
MSVAITATKLVVRDVAACERFYQAIGLKVVSRNIGGEGNVRQQQSWLSATGDASAHLLILSRFVELPLPARSKYPGEAWLAIRVADVDATLAIVEQSGGKIVRPGQDRPEHSVRAAVASDPEGHIIEVIGPMGGRSAA